MKSILSICSCALNVEVCSEEQRSESLPTVIGTCSRKMPMQRDYAHKLFFVDVWGEIPALKSLATPFVECKWILATWVL